jgi:hypothetical protein
MESLPRRVLHQSKASQIAHNPDAFPNLCRLNPKYANMEAAHNVGGKGTEQTAADMTLQRALVAIENSDLEAEE